ncbi:MAG: phosphoglycerate dehydrogenase [Clostridiaceae bacterium]|nr:phosphoglycerate dehydrogenase [Clostridiaceae bacterium]
MKMKILITPKSFRNYKHKAYPLLEEKGYEIIENDFGRTMTENEIVRLAGEGVEGIIIGVDPLPANVLEQLRDLRAISKYGVGMDNIDLSRAAELGIKVKNAVGTNSVSVAELAVALMFTMSRKIPVHSAAVKAGGWDRSIGFELTGKKLGLVGGGQIGREVAKRARGLGMDVTIYDPYFSEEDFLVRYQVGKTDKLEELLSQSDIISLHLPATSETRQMINSATLDLMKPNAVLINTSRGELVDEEALYEALSSGRIAGAAQDVFSSEPPAKDEKLLQLDNFILTPHLGAFTGEAVEKMALVSTNNLLEMLGHKE